MSAVYIIAEAGVNHNGSLDRAIEMIDVAAAAGVDAVKFQTFIAENLVTRDAVKANYQQKVTDAAESQFEMLKKLELSIQDFEVLKKRCEQRGVDFLSTPFDLVTIDMLVNLGVAKWKLPSGELTNLPYLRKIGALKHDVILSTGMSDLAEVSAAVELLESSGLKREQLILLHCNSEYPTEMQDVNLRAMQTLGSSFAGLKGVGYSDHTLGIEIPIAAVAMGATLIEKHYTLDQSLPGPDHRASLEPGDLRAMVNAIRNVEVALGDGQKRPSGSELKNRQIARKSIVAARAISVGEVFSEENLTVKRPGAGMNPMLWNQLIGVRSKYSYLEDECIRH
jgi:N,N'-diacetyllegionaminate synthase